MGLGGLALGLAGCDRPPGADVQHLAYGTGPSQFGELSLPSGPGPFPVVVVIHGGFWGTSYGLELGRPLAADLIRHGVAAWNIEYRRVGSGRAGGGGWPATGDDVAAALDRLRGIEAPLDLRRVVTLGHSAGGHLAAWAASRRSPGVAVTGVVSQAGVLDLVGCAQTQLGGGAAQRLLGGEPDRVPDVYADASPLARLPVRVPVTCVHGTNDITVPIEQSQRYVEAATRAGSAAVRLESIERADHFGPITVGDPAWEASRAATLALVG